MNFTIEQDERGTIFRPKESRLDSLLAPELKAEFLILAQPDVDKLIIDLGDVEFVDSAGLSALLLARRQMVAHGGDVMLVGVRPEVRSLLELTQLDRIFPMFDTSGDALDAPQLSAVLVTPDGIASPYANKPAFGAAALAGFVMDEGGDEDEDDYDDDDYDDNYDDDYDDEAAEETEESAEEDEDDDEELDDEEAYSNDEEIVYEDESELLDDDFDDEDEDEDF